MDDPILKWFEYEHLADPLQEATAPFAALARKIAATVTAGPERSVALRKLLEAKDAAVRAVVHPGG
jgi:hypothetical protein